MTFIRDLIAKHLHLAIAAALAGGGFALLGTAFWAGVWIMAAGGLMVFGYVKEDPARMETLIKDVVAATKKR